MLVLNSLAAIATIIGTLVVIVINLQKITKIFNNIYFKILRIPLNISIKNRKTNFIIITICFILITCFIITTLYKDDHAQINMKKNDALLTKNMIFFFPNPVIFNINKNDFSFIKTIDLKSTYDKKIKLQYSRKLTKMQDFKNYNPFDFITINFHNTKDYISIDKSNSNFDISVKIPKECRITNKIYKGEIGFIYNKQSFILKINILINIDKTK